MHASVRPTKISVCSLMPYGARGVETFYPAVTVEFSVSAPGEHHHVPLLLSPYGYSTYRGT